MKEYYNSILVPTDFSEQSLLALEQSFNLARLNNIAITLLYVIPEHTNSFYIPFFSKVQTQMMTEQYEKECMGKLNEIIHSASKKTSVIIRPIVKTGKIYEQIIELSEQILPKYIMMAVNSIPISSKKKSTIGSNTLKVIKGVNCPVITIRGNNFRNGCRSIVLPLDLTKQTEIKVDNAIRLAKYYDATIKVFSCIFSDEKETIEQLTQKIESVRKRVLGNSIVCTTELQLGIKGKDTASKMILDYTKEVEGDLIVIMTQQEKDWVEFFVGSTAQEIISSSAIPVMSFSPNSSVRI